MYEFTRALLGNSDGKLQGSQTVKEFEPQVKVLGFILQVVGDTETFWAQEQEIENRLLLTLIWQEHGI